ncbi:MAG: CoA transferase [Caulobacterales bacterium]|nr:CoA transferase [Caulobacterales bacterium]
MLEFLDVLQVFPDRASDPGRRAVRFAAGLAADLGASVYLSGSPPTRHAHGFYDLDETPLDDGSPAVWADEVVAGRHRVVLTTMASPQEPAALQDGPSQVVVALEDWQTEDTLFASSGVAHLYGEAGRAPLTPAANLAAHTIGYAAFAALVSVAAKAARFGARESAVVPGAGAFAWINWKSVVSAELGKELRRQGAKSDWPVLACKDGHVAFLQRERDWPAVVDMIGDPALRAEDLQTFDGRRRHPDRVMEPIRRWCRARTKNELTAAFAAGAIPGAPVLGLSDVLRDPLLLHRDAFKITADGGRLPRPPHRIAQEARGSARPRAETSGNGLPLSGMRVLDFGIITAGAGVSALLADMGAEVLKIEAHNRFDPFRVWAFSKSADGEGAESPVFKSNNRNKLGVAIDLKTQDGKRDFLALAETADIVLENYRRGVLDRLGLTFEALRQANPAILLASISGQGLDGPGATHTTFGSTLEANAGMAALTRYEDGPPFVSGPNLNYPDQIICLAGAAYVAAAAVDCRLKGLARHIDISQRDCTLYQLGDVIGHVSSGGAEDLASVKAAVGRPVLSGLFACADGAYAALSAPSEDIAARVDGLSACDADAAARWASEHTSEEAVGAFIAAGGGGARCRTGFDLLRDPTLFDRQIFARSPNGALVKGFPFQLANTPMSIQADSPKVGEHTNAIFTALRSEFHGV